MTSVIRWDVGSWNKPYRNNAGGLVVSGRGSKTGIQEYRNPDGTTRRELRLPEDVFHDASLSGFRGLPITEDHPSDMVSLETMSQVQKGTILTAGHQDGDHVGLDFVVTDPGLIQKMESGAKRQLSVGYQVDLDETPGNHPEFGRYDAIQRKIVPNHIAVLAGGRAGPTACARMDSAYQVDGPAEDAAEHDRLGNESVAKQRACETAGDHAGARRHEADAHEHYAQRDALAGKVAPNGKPRADSTSACHHATVMPKCGLDVDTSNPEPAVNLEQALAALAAANEKIGTERSRADAAMAEIEGYKKDAEKSKARKDARDEAQTKLATAEAALATAQGQVDNLTAKLTDAEKLRTDAAADLTTQVAARVKLETIANAILGAVDKDNKPIDRSALSNRDIKVAVVKHVDSVDIAADRHDAYVEARFDGAVERQAAAADSVAATRQTIIGAPRADGKAGSVTNLMTTDEVTATAKMREDTANAWQKSTTTQKKDGE